MLTNRTSLCKMIALALPNLVCGENKEKTEQKNKILELKQKHLA